jgi:hypothetical protein
MKNVFSDADVNEIIARIQTLKPSAKGLWGKMTVAQMLAHCNVTYEMIYDNIHPKPGALARFFLTWFVKDSVVNDKPYKKNSMTAPAFMIKTDKDFAVEQKRLIAYIRKTQQNGTAFFDQKESLSFGKLSIEEWNNLMYKHLDHHLSQFGV